MSFKLRNRDYSCSLENSASDFSFRYHRKSFLTPTQKLGVRSLSTTQITNIPSKSNIPSKITNWKSIESPYLSKQKPKIKLSDGYTSSFRKVGMPKPYFQKYVIK